MLSRSQAKALLEAQVYDVVIIGGGASGLGTALDCQMRGLQTALVDAGDYGGGTSATSTKLLHGGVRYLEKAFKELDFGQYKLVREALRERSRVLQNAPHLSQPIGIILPIYSWWQKLYFGVGLWFYDRLAGSGRIGPSKWIPASDFDTAFRPLAGSNAIGGWLFWDGQFDDTRLCLSLAISATQQGAVLCNYQKVVGLEKPDDNGIVTVNLQDSLDGSTRSIRAKAVVNATGPWADKIRLMARPTAKKRLRPSQGIHLMVPNKGRVGEYGMLIPKTDDGRVIFVLPWQNSIMIGTTETEVADVGQNPQAELNEAKYLLEHTNRYLAQPIGFEEVTGVFAGYRPLVSSSGKTKTESLIRNHEVEVFEEAQVVSILGGKWTTYRQMAEETADAVQMLLKTTNCDGCSTLDEPLWGHPNNGSKHDQLCYKHLPYDIKKHLSSYGSGLGELLAAGKELKGAWERLVEDLPYTLGEAVWLIQNTQAITPKALLENRMRIRTQSNAAAKKALEKVKTYLIAQLEKDGISQALINNYEAELQAESEWLAALKQ